VQLESRKLLRTASLTLSASAPRHPGILPTKGGFYWIVDYYQSQNASDNISFVSDDYYICNASIEDFEIEVEEIEKRFLK